MMERLDSIAPILQYGNAATNEWSLPCEPEAIPALQNWLEQLSANIQTTEDNIYPDILQQKATPAVTMVTSPTPSPQQQQQDLLLSSEDYDLYPKLSDNNVWTSTTFQPHQQEQPKQHTTSASESSYIHTPPAYEQHYSPPNSASTYDYKNVKAQFWSPSYITSPVIPSSSSTGGSSNIAAPPPPLPPRPQQAQAQIKPQPEVVVVDYYTPSDAIDFDVVRKFDHVQPNLVFETTKMEADSGPVTPVLSNQPTTTFDDKKELVHMMNVFSAPNTDLKYKKKEEPPVVIVTKEEEDEKALSNKKKEQVQFILSSPVLPRRPSVSSDGSSIIYYNYSDEEEEEEDNDFEEEEEEEVKSPYADLVDMIQNMKVVEDEESIRKRHVLLVDTLYKKIAQASPTTTTTTT